MNLFSSVGFRRRVVVLLSSLACSVALMCPSTLRAADGKLSDVQDDSKTLTIPAKKFSRGDVEEKSDEYGDFMRVRSVVEYDLDVTGIKRLKFEVKSTGGTALQTYVNGKLKIKASLPLRRDETIGLHTVPEWTPVGMLEAPAGTKRMSLVLQYDITKQREVVCVPRHIYQLRFTITKGSGVPKLRDAGRKPWDHYSWLLDLYPLSDTIQEYPLLRPREPFQFDKSLPEHPTGYSNVISSDKYGWQTGNLFYRCGRVDSNRLRPSLGKFKFGTHTTPEAKNIRLGNLTGEVGNIELRSADGKLIKLKGTSLQFQPHHLETCFEAPGVKMKVDSAIDFTDMLEAKITLTANKPIILSLSGSFNFPGKWWRQESGIWLSQTIFNYILGLDVKSNVDVRVTGKEKPIGYCIELAPSKQVELVMRLKPGYRVKDVLEPLISQRKSSISVAQRSRQEWHDYFSRIVPPFSCSDERFVNLYYMIAYAARFNLVDIPFEPYLRPYLTYSKSYFRNIIMYCNNEATDTLNLRWLNDKSMGEQVIAYCLENPGQRTPLDPGIKQRRSLVFNDPLFYYEFAKCSDNAEFFDIIKKLIRTEAEHGRWFGEFLCKKDDILFASWLGGGVYAECGLRYRPFLKKGRKWMYGVGGGMNQPIINIDQSSCRYQFYRMAAAHARADGDTSEASRLEERAKAIRKEINRLMWDDKIGFYFDYATKDKKRSDVMSVQAFTTLWDGVADRSKAARLVKEHLTNPKEFWWDKYVVPATSVGDPRSNPGGYCDGAIVTNYNNWVPFQGLLRTGYRDVAVELFWRTIDLHTAHGIRSWSCDHFSAIDARHMGDVCPDAGVVVDMILRCGTGFVPRTDELFEFDPLILGPKLKSLDWGPYLYKKHWIEVHWRASDGDSKWPAGLTIMIDKARFHLAQPKHVLLQLDNGKLRYVPLTPDPLDFRRD